MVTPAIKWGFEFDEGEGRHPVAVVDYCSEVNVRENPWDGVNGAGEKVMTKNKWIGMPCPCKEGKTDKCTHGAIMAAEGLIEFIGSSLQIGGGRGLAPKYAEKGEEFFERFVNECELFNEGQKGVGDWGQNSFFEEAGAAAERTNGLVLGNGSSLGASDGVRGAQSRKRMF